MTDNTPNRNPERVVKCPVEGCDAEKLARGMHLHIRQSVGNGHGERGEIPDSVSLDNLEEVGTQEVELHYPEDREVENVARMCPYCREVFRGKNGVLIHLGQVAGRKNHPPNGSKIHVPEDFPVVELDEKENVVNIVTDTPEWVYQDAETRRFVDRPTFASFTKDEVDYLAEVIEETGDERAESIILRAYMESLG